MTREEFYQKNCLMCGSQRCFMDDESIAGCGYYNGNIEGIEKRENLHEILTKINKKRKSKMKALIIVDMQNDFIDGALGTPEAQAIVPNVVNKMKEHKNTNTIILFTKDTHNEHYLDTPEGKKLPVPHCIKGTPGWSIEKSIASEFKADGYMTYSSESVINGRVLKPTFGSYDLLKILDSDEVEFDEIELCGVCTDICVISNAIMIKNFFPDVKVVVDASCCAGVTPEKHAAALEVMKSCQIDVIGE